MATSKEYVEYVCEQLRGLAEIRYKKMFGEYMVYVNERPLLLVCDNTVFIKKFPLIIEIMADASTGLPYEGAKEHYVLDVDDREKVADLIAILLS